MRKLTKIERTSFQSIIDNHYHSISTSRKGKNKMRGSFTLRKAAAILCIWSMSSSPQHPWQKQRHSSPPSMVVSASPASGLFWNTLRSDHPWLVPAASVAVCGCWGFASCLKVVTTGDECLIERFGRYHRKLGAGWHFLLPIVETISFEVTTREQVLDVPPQQCYTKDNAPLKADAVVFMRIQDVVMAKYNVEDIYGAIMNLCLTQLREEVGKLTLDESFSSRERINFALLKDLNGVCRGWGIEITRVELQNLQPSRTIEDAMELQMAAERKKRAAILHSEGEKTTLVNKAEGRAEAAIKDAEARQRATILGAEAESNRQRIEAEGLQVAIRAVSEAIGNNGDSAIQKSEATEAAVQFLIAIRYLEMQGKIAESDNSKVILLPSKDSMPMTYGGLKFLME
jgi:regulator of protease activity HflC (stomatin/prohibitin superfamily)